MLSYRQVLSSFVKSYVDRHYFTPQLLFVLKEHEYKFCEQELKKILSETRFYLPKLSPMCLYKIDSFHLGPKVLTILLKCGKDLMEQGIVVNRSTLWF